MIIIEIMESELKKKGGFHPNGSFGSNHVGLFGGDVYQCKFGKLFTLTGYWAIIV